MNPRMTRACSHQLTRAAGPGCSPKSRRNVTISVMMNPPISTDSHDTVGPSAAGRTKTRRISKPAMPASTASAKGTSSHR